jgi:hypothetical protein
MPIKLLIEEANPPAKDLFGFGCGMRLGSSSRLGLRGCHMCMDDKPRRRDVASTTEIVRR